MEISVTTNKRGGKPPQHKEKKMTKENLTDEERAYETYLWEQNLDYSLNLETQASLNKESWLREREIEEKNLAEYEEEMFYEEDPSCEYSPTTASEPVADTIKIYDGIPF